MARVRWADIPDEVPGAAEAAAVPAVEDAWGPEDEAQAADDAHLADQPTRAVSQAQQSALAALLAAANRQPRAPEPQQRTKPLYKQQQAAPQAKAKQQLQQEFRMYQVPSLHKLCMTVLGQHVTALVEQLGDQVQWLPADVRAVLLAVARYATACLCCCLHDQLRMNAATVAV